MIARTRISVGLIFVATTAVCEAADAPRERIAFTEAPRWRKVCAGVELADLQLPAPRLKRGHALRINLAEPGLEFVTTPGNGDRPLETDGLKTTSFLRQFGCQAAINAGPFGPVVDDEGRAHDISGLHISRVVVVSPDEPRRPALLIDKQRRCRIVRPPIETADVEFAVPGFQVVLEQGRVCVPHDVLHPRTAVGLTEDGATLLWLVIDGRQARYSSGASLGDVANWLHTLGAHDGLNLDGGGTTTLAVAGPDGPQLVNRPIHGGVPGRERVAASHLGLRLTPPRDGPIPAGRPVR